MLTYRTRLWSFIIFLTEYAREIVTARGKPSGMATTSTVTPVIRKLTSSDQSELLYDSLSMP